jgi:hypothetical protein
MTNKEEVLNKLEQQLLKFCQWHDRVTHFQPPIEGSGYALESRAADRAAPLSYPTREQRMEIAVLSTANWDETASVFRAAAGVVPVLGGLIASGKFPGAEVKAFDDGDARVIKLTIGKTTVSARSKSPEDMVTSVIEHPILDQLRKKHEDKRRDYSEKFLQLTVELNDALKEEQEHDIR